VDFDWTVVTSNFPLLLSGVRLTVFITVVSFVLATALGLVVALGRLSRFRAVRTLTAGYINVMRSIPLLVFIVFVYYGVAIAFDLSFLTAIQAGMLALVLQYSAWLGEIFRSGLQAVSTGQREAAMAVGMGRRAAFFRIVLPQAVRIVVPPTGNMMVGMVKDSSLVYLLGVPELFRQAQLLANRTFRYFEIYLATVAIYLFLTLLVDLLVKVVERGMTPTDPLAAPVGSYRPLLARRRSRLAGLVDRVGREGHTTAPTAMSLGGGTTSA
jgi:polar amino acid transport system permease protein